MRYIDKIIKSAVFCLLIIFITGAAQADGGELPINHLLIVPRADGRGISVSSEKAYLMVRGDYEIY